MEVSFISNENLVEQQMELQKAILNILSKGCKVVNINTSPYTTGVTTEVKWSGGKTESRNTITFLSQILYECKSN